MDNVSGSEQIVKIFSDKYCELYNSVSYKNLQLANIISDNTVDVKMYCMNEHNSTCTLNESIAHNHSVTPDMVQSAINKIKPGKSDCTDGMLSDNLTNGTLKLNMFISVFIFCYAYSWCCAKWLIIINVSTNTQK